MQFTSLVKDSMYTVSLFETNNGWNYTLDSKKLPCEF